MKGFVSNFYIIWLRFKIGLFVILIFASFCIRAENQQYGLFPLNYAKNSLPDSTIKLVTPSNSFFNLYLVKADDLKDTLNMMLTPFTDENGIQVKLELSHEVSGFSDFSSCQDSIVSNGNVIRLVIKVPELSTSSEYSGYLFLMHDKLLIRKWLITIIRPKINYEASLVIDQNEQTLRFPHSVFSMTKDASFSVTLREETGQLPLEGLFVRLLEDNMNGQKLYPKQDLNFVVNGNAIEDFWNLPQEDSVEDARRYIEPGEQVTVTGYFKELKPGTYKTKLKFLAKNSKQSTEQDLILTIYVRRTIYSAALVLTLAILFSFIVNTMLNMRKERLEFRKQLLDIRPAWLYKEPLNPSVIWTRAMLKQVREMSGRYLLTGTDTLVSYLKDATIMINILGRLRDIRVKMERSTLSITKQHRANKLLRSVLSYIGTGRIDEKLSNDITKHIEDLEKDFDLDEFNAYYIKSLTHDIEKLLEKVKLESIENGEFKQVVTNLYNILKEKVEKGIEANDINYDHKYAALNIFWGRKKYTEEIKKLIDCWKKYPNDTGPFFRIADDEAWKRLKVSGEKNIHIRLEDRNSWEPVRTYQPIKFRIEPDDSSLKDNYLFQYGLQYKWKIEIDPRNSSGWWSKIKRVYSSMSKSSNSNSNSKYPQLEVTSKVPFITQYVPVAGKLLASVEIYYENDDLNEPIQISNDFETIVENSSDFSIVRSVQTVEIVSTITTLFIALISGLLMFYFDNLTFGSLKDYITLFLWGIALDQTKNIMQSLNIKPPSGSNILGG